MNHMLVLHAPLRELARLHNAIDTEKYEKVVKNPFYLTPKAIDFDQP